MTSSRTQRMDLSISRQRHQRKAKIVLNLWCWAFMALTVLFYAVFQGYPILSSIYNSFLDWSGLTVRKEFVGLANYNELMGDRMYWNAFANSFRYMIMLVPLQLAVSLFLAYLLNNEQLKARTLYRSVFFVPVVTTTSIVGIVMIFIWSVQGPINQLLVSLGITPKAINYLGNKKYAMQTVVLISVWKDCGTYMIYWLAGLQSVSKDLYEAATVDGASRSRTFFSIVLPLILPIAQVIAVLCTINSLKIFDMIKTMTEGGPFYATDVVATYVYRTAFSSEMGMPRLGYASAAALTFGLCVIVIGIILNGLKSLVMKNRPE